MIYFRRLYPITQEEDDTVSVVTFPAYADDPSSISGSFRHSTPPGLTFRVLGVPCFPRIVCHEMFSWSLPPYQSSLFEVNSEALQ